MDMIASIGNFMSGAGGKGLNSLLSLAGLGTNIFTGIQNQQQQNRLLNAQKYVTNLVQNPSKMAAAAAGYTQPLTAGLTDEIGNQVQGTLAEHGLGSSPAAYTQTLTQALAPYVENNQTQGFNNLMASLGLLQKPQQSMPFGDISKLLTQLKLGGSTPDSSSGGGNLDAILSEIENPANLQTSYDTSGAPLLEDEAPVDYAYASPMY